MPTRSRGKGKRKQPRRRLSIGAQIRQKQQRKQAKIVAARRRQLDLEYRRRLVELQKTGTYQPKSRKLTKTRRAAINKSFRKFEEFITGDSYVFVPIPTRSKRRRRKVLKLAKQNEIATTRKGLIFEKPKGFVSAEMIYDRKTRTYKIRTEKKIVGPTGEKTVTEILPIEPLSSIDKELKRVERDAEILGPTNGESLAYRVTLNEEGGYSHQIFETPDTLVKYLASGASSSKRGRSKTVAHNLQVYRSVSVMKVNRKTYFRDHPRPTPNPYRGRPRRL